MTKKKKEVEFDWKVLNYEINHKKVEPYNIFNNFYVHKGVNELCAKMDDMTDEEFVNELDHIIKWQEWSRCEYEMGVCNLFETDIANIRRIDCWEQAHMNIELIADYVKRKYREG